MILENIKNYGNNFAKQFTLVIYETISLSFQYCNLNFITWLKRRKSNSNPTSLPLKEVRLETLPKIILVEDLRIILTARYMKVIM
jgi:hypothetical protein